MRPRGDTGDNQGSSRRRGSATTSAVLAHTLLEGALGDCVVALQADDAVCRPTTATMRTVCDAGEKAWEGDRVLELDGAKVPVPPSAELPADVTTTAWLEGRIAHDAIVITQLSEHGPGEVVADYTDELSWDLGSSAGPAAEPTSAACGCRQVHGGVLPLVGLLLLSRRRPPEARPISAATADRRA